MDTSWHLKLNHRASVTVGTSQNLIVVCRAVDLRWVTNAVGLYHAEAASVLGNNSRVVRRDQVRVPEVDDEDNAVRKTRVRHLCKKDTQKGNIKARHAVRTIPTQLCTLTLAEVHFLYWNIGGKQIN